MKRDTMTPSEANENMAEGIYNGCIIMLGIISLFTLLYVVSC